MSVTKRFILFLMTLFVFFCVYWAIGRNVMVKTITAQIEEKQSEGYKVAHKGLSVGGFPLKFRAQLSDPDIASPRAIGKPWSIKADDWRIEALVFSPLKWTGTHRGEARIDVRGPKGERWLFDARPLNIDMTARAKINGDLRALDIIGKNFKTQAVIGTLPPIVAIDEARLAAAPAKTDMRYDININNIYLEKNTLVNFQKIFGPRIENITGAALAIGLTSLDDETIETWQENGQITSEGWEVSWGGTLLQGGFDLKQSQKGLSGVIRIEVNDINALISRLQEASIFTAGQARNAKLASVFLPVNQNGRQELTLNLRDGFLTLFGQKIYAF